jgi:Double zinc ribbon
MQEQQPLINQAESYRAYNGIMVFTLISVCVISMAMLIIPFFLIFNLNDTPSGHSFLLHNINWLSNISAYGLLLLLGEAIFVMILDWRGAVSLRGLVKGQTTQRDKMVNTGPGYALLYIFFPEILVPIYVARILFYYIHKRGLHEKQQKHQLQVKIATLEANMGILPPTSGTCRVCKKPLVIGADFCQYCSAPVVEQPKVCPACATTASPDAKWCPRCRTALV